MSKFKDAIARDIEGVFLNLEEFGELISLAGQADIPAVVDGIHSVQRDATDGRAGVTYETAVIYVDAVHLPRPRSGREITWNGAEWWLADAHEEAGLYILELYRERS